MFSSTFILIYHTFDYFKQIFCLKKKVSNLCTSYMNEYIINIYMIKQYLTEPQAT